MPIRYLVSKCCICGLVYGKQPLPANYGKIGIAKYDDGDLETTGYCSPCSKKANKELDKYLEGKKD